jgi:hypothetical protein
LTRHYVFNADVDVVRVNFFCVKCAPRRRYPWPLPLEGTVTDG